MQNVVEEIQERIQLMPSGLWKKHPECLHSLFCLSTDEKKNKVKVHCWTVLVVISEKVQGNVFEP